MQDLRRVRIDEGLYPGVCVLTMDALQSRNALDAAMVDDLVAGLTHAAATEARVVVLRGSGRYFSSGASASVLRSLLDGSLLPRELDLPRKLMDCPVPVLACVEGHAVGGGFALALACDLFCVASDAKLSFNFVSFGLPPGMGTTQLAALAFGVGRAHELLYSGRIVRGEELRGLPGVCEVAPRTSLFDVVLDRAARIALQPAEAVRILKAELSAHRRRAYERAFAAEQAMHARALASPALRCEILARIAELEG